MEPTRVEADALSRLRTVQAKVRQLADSNPTARDMLRRGFDDFNRAVARFNAEQERICGVVIDAARELLRSGRLLGDAPSAGTVRPVAVWVDGQYPHALVAEMEAAGKQENWPADLSRRVAEATLTVLDSGLSVQYEVAYERNPDVWYVDVIDTRDDPALSPSGQIMVRVPRPEGVEAVYNPAAVDDETLGRIIERQPDTWRAIVCYRLGGLADAGRPDKVVPAPSDVIAGLRWWARFPVIDVPNPASELKPEVLPAALAERMLVLFERWVAEADDDAYRPATWFPKGMAARLRMAAQKNRKTKRVATRTIDGVVCYRVADARRWWPKDVPDKSK